jgi:hypothetical protein
VLIIIARRSHDPHYNINTVELDRNNKNKNINHEPMQLHLFGPTLIFVVYYVVNTSLNMH